MYSFLWEVGIGVEIFVFLFGVAVGFFSYSNLPPLFTLTRPGVEFWNLPLLGLFLFFGQPIIGLAAWLHDGCVFLVVASLLSCG